MKGAPTSSARSVFGAVMFIIALAMLYLQTSSSDRSTPPRSSSLKRSAFAAKSQCQGPNTPDISDAFWMALDGYQKFSNLSMMMQDKAEKLSELLSNANTPDLDAVANTAIDLLALGYEALLTVRPNPVPAPAQKEPYVDDVELSRTWNKRPYLKSRFSQDPPSQARLEREVKMRKDRIAALERRLVAESHDGSAIPFHPMFEIRNAFLMYDHLTSMDIIEQAAWHIPGNIMAAMEFTERVVAHIMKYSRAHLDPSYRPTDIFDFGARAYAVGYQHTLWKGRVQEDFVPQSSVRFLEMHYPGFKDAKVHLYEADSGFAASYSPFLQANSNAKLHLKAIWVHNKGVCISYSDMLSIGTTPQQGNSFGRLLSTVDIRDALNQVQSNATIKIDVEFAEYQVFERIEKENLWPRIGELILECHTLGNRLFPLRSGKDGAVLSGRVLQMFNLVRGHGLDCYLMHDLARSRGSATNYWP